jgi:hypothetical protein
MKKVLTIGVVLTTILATMGVAAFVPVASAATLVAGDLIKASGPAVYFYAADGERYTFPTQSTYMSWYDDFTGVKTVTDDELAAIDLAGNVVVRPGTNLVKITTVPKVYAVEPNGALVWVETEDAATALYGDNWASLVIDIPDGFWTNYADTDEALDGTAYPAGTLVKMDGGADIYYVNADGSWSMIADEDAFALNGWSMDDVITTSLTMPSAGDAISEATYNDTSQGGGGGTVTVGGGLTVALSSGTPASDYVSKGAQNALFAKFDFNAAGGDIEVDEIVLSRAGLGYDADIGTIRLYSNGAQIGTDQSLNTTTHEVTFKNLDWAIASGSTETLSIKANVAASPSGTNDYFSVASVALSGDGTISGLPVSGNSMQFSALSVGNLNVVASSGGSTVTVISGETEKELGCWNLTTDSTEGFYVDSFKVTNIGSASSSDAQNFYLKVSSTTIDGSEVEAMDSNGIVNFDLSADPYFIDKSKVKKVCVYGDITAGITVSKTLRFQVAETKDVVARGDSSAGEVLITITANADFTSQSAKTNTIAQGSATLAQNAAYAPTSGTALVKGVEMNKMAAYKLTAGVDEGVRLTKLRFVLAGTNVANTDFSNWQLYKIVDGEEVLVDVSGSVSGTNITFEDTTDGLLDVAKSENETLVIYSDVSTSAGGDETGVHVYVGANATTNTVARIQGLDSGDYITSGVTLSGVATGNAQTFTIGSSGDLVVSKAATSPAADNVAKGATAVHFTSINLYATGEDMEVSDLTLSGASDQTLTSDLANAYITDEDGNQLGSTCSAFASTECSYSFSYTVPKETNKVIKVYADVLSGATTDAVTHIDMDTVATDITTTGVASATDITETGTATGSNMTVQAPTLVAAMANSPIAGSYVSGSTEVTVGRLLLTAGTSEDVKVTSIKVVSDDAATIAADGDSAASTNWQNIKLVDNNSGVQYGITKNFTNGGGAAIDYATFTGISNLTVTAGQTADIKIVADGIGTTTAWSFGVTDAATDITATGVSSNQSATVTPNGSVVVSTAATLVTAGDLTVSKAADMPATQQLVSGSTGNELAKYKFSASYEDIDITSFTLELSADFSADVSNVKLYLDGVLLGDANGYVFTGTTKAINFAAGTFVVVKDEDVTLTVKADMSPKAQVTTSATNKTIAIDAATGSYGLGGTGTYVMTAKGVSSGGSITGVNDSGDDIYVSNNFTVHKGVLTVSANTSTPSGTATAGAGFEILRIDLTATGDDITVSDIEFVRGGTCTVAGAGATALKSSDGETTYETWAAAAGLDKADWNVSVDGGATWSTALSVSAGTTKTLKLFGDSSGCTTNQTLQVSVTAPTAANGTVAGVEWEDSSGTNINLATTKNLPVNGGSLVY